MSKEETIHIEEDYDESFISEIYKLAGINPYRNQTVPHFRKEPIKPDGIYYQYHNGCVLYSLINIGYLDDEYIPSSMKCYKNHTYSQDEKTDEIFIRRTLSLIDLAELWIELRGISPYKNKETNEVIELPIIRNEIFKLFKLYIKEKDNKYLKEAFNIAKNHERFLTVIGNLPIKFILLSQSDFKDKLNALNLKSAIDQGFILPDTSICCCNHFVVYNKTSQENDKKIYYFSDSMIDYYKKAEVGYVQGSIIKEDIGAIECPENGELVNIIESHEKTVGFLKVLL